MALLAGSPRRCRYRIAHNESISLLRARRRDTQSSTMRTTSRECSSWTMLTVSASDTEAQGHVDFVAVAVAGPADTVSPCGACRQVLAEFLDPGAVVVFPLDARLVAVPLGDLLPHAFGPSDVLSGADPNDGALLLGGARGRRWAPVPVIPVHRPRSRSIRRHRGRR